MLQCPNSTFYTPVDGTGPVWTSVGTTPFEGATRVEDCVPVQSQLAPEAGQAFFPVDAFGSAAAAMQGVITSTPGGTLATCLNSCAANKCCFAQYDINQAGGVCRTALLQPDASNGTTTGLQLHYKLPPAGPGIATLSLSGGEQQSEENNSQVNAKALASGWYGTCAVPAAQAAAWQGLGSALGPDARTFAQGGAVWHNGTTRAVCKAMCEGSNVCLGFLFDAGSGACLYRGGVDALGSRAFFVVPTAAAWTA